ncbi:transglycosylase SLT domain-containing protein [Pararhizobium mangrovi]|uniref:Transglycosylase SLT domain-containing protein n=1 Tax=Pararhizobium mangrovi TaxID=2590452 RepID=A0A506UAR1_9HYPH|nr:transglycosylase SLT domain-containing protein [Pararhizobium mangrovi]TPW30456.1 hypothetical protein FJU11_05460 [Pararhizobium mangrovi]
MRITVLVLLLALGGCATAPHSINNVCSVFDQRDGWITDWYSDAKQAQQAYGVPVPVLMATVRKESGFKARARPARKWILGIIPWKRPSSAYGFSQALDGTWDRYKRETGHWAAKRNNFGDAIDFVGWYHRKSYERNGIPLNDAYDLYLAYYFGHAGYARGDWRSNAAIRNYAAATQKMANQYAAQLRSCGR